MIAAVVGIGRAMNSRLPQLEQLVGLGLPATKPSPPGGAPAQGTVFVIDDEAPMGNALRRLLSEAGLAVHVFVDARAFIDAYQRRGPACALLDLHMPGMNGLELHQELVARGLGIPVIFLTGSGSVAHAVRAMRA